MLVVSVPKYRGDSDGCFVEWKEGGGEEGKGVISHQFRFWELLTICYQLTLISSKSPVRTGLLILNTIEGQKRGLFVSRRTDRGMTRT